jgi:chemotaxis protein MotB
MNICTVTRVIICAALLTGCVSTDTHKKALAQLEEARKALEISKKQAAAEADRLQEQLADVNTRVAALKSGETSAQEEIARLQKSASELEADAARANDLVKQLSERDQELSERLKAEGAEKARLEQERAAQEARLKVEEEEKARLEQERAAKEAEIQRLTRTHEELTKSLEAEIAKGDIKIKQVRDRLTINMVDRVLFDSGQSKVKPSGLQVLKQVSDILKNVTDKQIRIEGHTDNVPIGVKLKERFQTNWELSTARATSVVRYLIDEGGVDRASLLAVGYADTKPIASNDTEEGRTANRRIEIALYPKDLSEIANELKP